MATRGQVRLNKVWKMLRKCAPGYKREERDHNWVIRWNGKTYYRFPQGKHGRTNPEIELGHVKSLVRLFGIQDCAKRELQQLA